MPFVGAIITPHSPLLLPTIGKEYVSQTKKTLKSLAAAAIELHAMRPDGLLIIHPHGRVASSTFTAEVAETFTAIFTEFGDLVTSLTCHGDLTLAHDIKNQADQAGFPMTLTHDPLLSYDAAIPILGVPPSTLDTLPIVPLFSSTLDARSHSNFGRVLADALHTTQRRIAMLVSAELSQHAAASAPGGFRSEGEVFDTTVIKALGKKQLEEQLLAIDPVITERAESCGYLPILMLAGLISHKNCHIRKLSYEHPFGIGLLTAVIHPA